jgi:hypothetical protein
MLITGKKDCTIFPPVPMHGASESAFYRIHHESGMNELKIPFSGSWFAFFRPNINGYSD